MWTERHSQNCTLYTFFTPISWIFFFFGYFFTWGVEQIETKNEQWYIGSKIVDLYQSRAINDFILTLVYSKVVMWNEFNWSELNGRFENSKNYLKETFFKRKENARHLTELSVWKWDNNGMSYPTPCLSDKKFFSIIWKIKLHFNEICFLFKLHTLFPQISFLYFLCSHSHSCFWNIVNEQNWQNSTARHGMARSHIALCIEFNFAQSKTQFFNGKHFSFFNAIKYDAIKSKV